MELYRRLARGQLLVLPGTGHATFEERAEVINAAIRTFLGQPDAKKQAP